VKTFSEYIMETNTTANMVYATRDFAVDDVRGDFDVEDYESEDPEDRKKMKPWEVENAEEANRRRNHILQWLKAAGANQSKAVTDKSLPLTPEWQSRTR
jgi:hypothetical protein